MAAESPLAVDLCPGLRLLSPLVAGPGAIGWAEPGGAFLSPSLGAIITPTVTLQSAAGAAPPRAIETSAGLLMGAGLPNPGLEEARKLQLLQGAACPVIVSILARTKEEWKELASGFEDLPGVAAIELNLTWSPALLGWGDHDRPPPELTLRAEMEQAVSSAADQFSRPVLARLPAFGIEVGEAARVAAAAGADAVCVGDSWPGMAFRPTAGMPYLSTRVGWLRGPAVKPLSIYQAWRAAHSSPAPVLAGGGIHSAEDVLEFLAAGATAVTLDLALSTSPPCAEKIAETLNLRAARAG